METVPNDTFIVMTGIVVEFYSIASLTFRSLHRTIACSPLRAVGLPLRGVPDLQAFFWIRFFLPLIGALPVLPPVPVTRIMRFKGEEH